MKWKKLFSYEEDNEDIKIEHYSEKNKIIEKDDKNNKLKKLKSIFTENDSYQDNNYDLNTDNNYESSKNNCEKENEKINFRDKLKNLFKTEEYSDKKENFDELEKNNRDEKIQDNNVEDKVFESCNNENKNNILNRVKILFSTEKNQYNVNDWASDEDQNRKSNNIKTNTAKEDLDKLEFSELDIKKFEEEDYSEFDLDKETSKKTLLNYIKEKIIYKFNKSKITNENENIDNLEENIDISAKLEEIEEKSLSIEEKDNKSILDTLNSLGIEANKIEDINIFEDRESKRTHPTLASMKVKRILQDQKIDNLSTKLVFEDSKEEFEKQINNTYKLDNNNNKKEDNNIHISKNKEKIEELQSAFNNPERKKNKLESKSKINYDSSIESAISEIKKSRDASFEDNKNYDIIINSDKEKIVKREKIKYTSISDVLKNKKEVLEDDIEKVNKNIIFNKKDKFVPEEVKNFRSETINNNNNNSSNSKINKTLEINHMNNLDMLISESNVTFNNHRDESEIEIKKLEDNLARIIEDKKPNISDNDKKEEISIEKVAKESITEYPKYEEIKKINLDSTSNYSDYKLEKEEIEELLIQNKIDSKTENVDIDYINKNFEKSKDNNDIDKFIEEKTVKKSIKNLDIKIIDTSKNTKEKDNNIMEKIEYKENLYSNDVKKHFFDYDNSITFGEYKNQDRGYRPVSRETIENNQKKLNQIFEKYSNKVNNINSSNKYIENKISSPTTKTVGKFKPSVVYSSVYGSNINNSANLTKKPNKVKKVEKSVNKLKNDSKNLFKEIASQDETVWNIEINSRAPKSKKK